MQKKQTISPLFINTDLAYEKLLPYHSNFIRGIGWDINSNPANNIGTNNPSNYGQNQLTKTPTRSNEEIQIKLPKGFNKSIGAYYSPTTVETFIFNFNEYGNHGIYVISGNSGIV